MDLNHKEANALALARERLAERERADAAYQATRKRGRLSLDEIATKKALLGIGRFDTEMPEPVQAQSAPCNCQHCNCDRRDPNFAQAVKDYVIVGAILTAIWGG